MTKLTAKLTITFWEVEKIYCAQIHCDQTVYTCHALTPSQAVEYLRSKLPEIYDSYDPIVLICADSVYMQRLDQFDISNDADTIRYIMSY